MSFKQLDEFPTLKLPIKGKTYVIASPDAQTGLWVQGKMAAAVGGETKVVLDDDQERDLHERILGPVHQEMLDDGVPWHTLKHVGATVVLWIMYDETIAERYWNEGDQAPKAPAKKSRKKSVSAAPPA